MPTIHFYPQPLSDGSTFTVFKTRQKKVVTLDIGAFWAKETIVQSPEDKVLYPSEELKALVPRRCTFGYDVIVQVGYGLFVHCRSEKEIINELAERNVSISEGEVGFLGRKFITYLAIAHRESRQGITRAMASRGGYILHLDGTCEGDSPHLFSGLDGIAELVLDNVKLPSEKADLLIPFLQQIKEQYGDPVALVHDMGKGILVAVQRVFPGKPDFICHFHFLKDIGKDLLEDEYQRIRNRLKKLKIRTLLRQKAKTLHKTMGVENRAVQSLKVWINKQNETSSFHQMPHVAAFAMIHWALDISGELNGYGFPFDLPHLLFYQRLKKVHSFIGQIWDSPLRHEDKIYNPLFQLLRLTKGVMDDPTLTKSVAQIEQRAKVFGDLRKALRIALPDGGKGLNDDGDGTDIKTIEEKVKEFRQQVMNDSPSSKKATYKKMIQQIDTYWEKLFADPIPVDTPNGRIFIQPQRTNNILERFFRDLKRRNRKRSGTSSLTKTLKAILSDTPLVKNLENEQYLTTILDGCATLEQRFARIDSKLVVEELKRAKERSEVIHPQLKKMIRQPGFMEKLRPLLAA
jgi:hypothetical protein